MAFSLFKVVKGLLIREENSLVPKELEIIPGGDGGVKTTLTTSQTSTDKIITLPDETDTLVGKITVDTLENKSIDSTGGVNTITTAASGNLAATELNAALSELQSDIDTRTLETDFQAHLTDTVDAHDASAISVTPSGNLAATEVQAALVELQSDIDTRALDADFQSHLNDTTDAHDASAISTIPAGNIAATDVQSALNELDTEKAKTDLSNLTSPTSINQSLLPSATNTHTIGNTSLLWSNLYVNSIGTSGPPNISVANRTLATSAGSVSVNYNTGVLSSTAGANTSIDWTNRILKDSSSVSTIDYSSSTSIKIGKTISYRNQGLTTEMVSKVIGSQTLVSGSSAVTEFELNTASYESLIVEYKIKGTEDLRVKTGTLYISATSGGGDQVSIVDTSVSIDSSGSSVDTFIFSASISSGVVTVTCNNTTASSGVIKYLAKKFAV